MKQCQLLLTMSGSSKPFMSRTNRRGGESKVSRNCPTHSSLDRNRDGTSTEFSRRESVGCKVASAQCSENAVIDQLKNRILPQRVMVIVIFITGDDPVDPVAYNRRQRVYRLAPLDLQCGSKLLGCHQLLNELPDKQQFRIARKSTTRISITNAYLRMRFQDTPTTQPENSSRPPCLRESTCDSKT